MPRPTAIPEPKATRSTEMTETTDEAVEVFHKEMIRVCLERVIETRARLLVDVRRLRDAGVDAGCPEAVAMADLLSGDVTYDLSGFDGNGWSVGSSGGSGGAGS